MRKLIVSMNVSLDGYMASTEGRLDWHFPYWSGQLAEYAFNLLQRADTIVLGRKTYEGMAGYWPEINDEPIALLMNDRKKLVFSRSLKTLSWNNAVLASKDLKDEILSLKQAQGKDLIIYGSGTIVKSCMHWSLVDEYIIWMHPLVLGEGTPLFQGLKSQLELNLKQIDSYSSGVAILHYERTSTQYNKTPFHSIFRSGNI